MKKLFTMVVVSAATFVVLTASAHGPFAIGNATKTKVSTPQNSSSIRTDASVTTCDTLINLNFATADSNAVFFAWRPPGVGFVSGNGALADTTGGLHTFPITSIGEDFHLPSTGFHVVGAIVEAAHITINPTAADTNLVIKAYVYDTTGTGAFGGIAPGSPIDSASTTLGVFSTQGAAQFVFTNSVNLTGKSFFITVALPLVTGDTLVLATNDGTTGNGNGWLKSPTGGGWASYDSLIRMPLGNLIFALACKTSTGIENLSGINDFVVYPNPSNGVFTSSMKLETASDVTTTVVDLTGNKIYESTDKSVTALDKTINLSTIAAGMYIVNVKTATGSVNQRIVIK